jgi:hypothetical protein
MAPIGTPNFEINSGDAVRQTFLLNSFSAGDGCDKHSRVIPHGEELDHAITSMNL